MFTIGTVSLLTGGALAFASLGDDEQEGITRKVFRQLSRDTGLVMGVQIPSQELREVIYGGFALINNANIHEASRPLSAYPSFGDFFTRWLHPDARQIDQTATLVSPVDGRMLIHGEISEDGLLEQIKGQTFTLDEFLRATGGAQISQVAPAGTTVSTIPWQRDADTSVDTEKNHDQLYYCVIYLAPRDYHRIHSPVDWVVKERIHFPGTLLSVSPFIVSQVPRVFARNERIALTGEWEHGFFSLTAVGATNVGSISIKPEPDIRTNIRLPDDEQAAEAAMAPSHAGYQPYFESHRGDEIATFHFGSTVVLIFNSPRGFVFNHEPYQRVQLGEPLGSFSDN